MDIIRISTTRTGGEANDQSYFPKISGDGRYVTFQSLASNLVSGDGNGVNDIFVKDLQSGEVIRASITPGGVAANNQSYFPSISGDGRLVAFQSIATNLVPGDTNRTTDVFVKDLETGALTRVNTTAAGVQAQGMSQSVTLSEDGSTAAFVSTAANLVPGDTNSASDVFVKNLATGAIVCASTTESGAFADGSSDYSSRHRPSLSADGQQVAFSSVAENLSSDDGPAWDIFVKDLQTGNVTLASVGSQPANGDSYQPAMTPDGRYVAFTSDASNLVAGDVNGRTDVFLKDLATGAIEMISDAWATDTGPGYSRHPAISDDGRYVIFTRVNLDLVDSDVFLKDRQTGALTLINTDAAGDPSDLESKFAEMSARGAQIVFLSYSTDLVPGDTNRRADVFSTSLLTPIVGTEGNNVVTGTYAAEMVQGLGGDDRLRGGPGNDAVMGGDGNDWISGGDGDDVAAGHAGNDTLFGGGGNDSLIGGPGNDSLHGGTGRDTLNGGEGNDTLNGFKDTDTLFGGAGADLFMFKAADQSPYGDGDTILDFATGIDRIDLSDVGVDRFIGGGRFVAGDGRIEARFDAALQQVQVDANDNGQFDAGDLEINGVTAVAAGDFIL